MTAEVAGAGDSRTGENPKVTSKFDRSHGAPRVPGEVAAAGEVATPTVAHERHAPSRVEQADHGTVHHYAPGHPAMGGLHRGDRAKHPTHDPAQHAREKHGYGGPRGR